MSAYKVLQDIESEDKLVGPLTPRQCIYAAIAIAALYLSFVAITKHVAFLIILLLPFIVFGAFFAFPWSKQQPTEVWALAKIRFFLKPRKRIWDQSGFKQLVTITAPKHIERVYTNGLSQVEVHSRLKALADTIDTRGWAIKNVDPIAYVSAQHAHAQLAASDRLIDPASMPQEVSPFNQSDMIDVMDEQNSRVAQQFDALISASTNARREHIKAEMSDQAPSLSGGGAQPVLPTPAAYWYVGQTPIQPPTMGKAAPKDDSSTTSTQISAVAEPSEAEMATIKTAAKKRKKSSAYSHLRVLRPPVPDSPEATSAAQTTVTQPVSPAILKLANNNDLDVATIARQAQRDNPDSSSEVSISLH